MTRSEFDDQSDIKRSKPSRRRQKKRSDEIEDAMDYKQKRSSKRFHRKKTLKEAFWETNDLRDPKKKG